MLSLSAKAKLAHSGSLRLLVVAAFLLAPGFSFIARAQQTTSREVAFPVTIRWDRKKGVKRYRVQLAADERFQNVFLDRRVIGDRYVVSDVSPGYYYWRVAPADFSQVGDFSRPVKIFISGGMIIPVKLPDTRATRSHSSPANIGRKIR